MAIEYTEFSTDQQEALLKQRIQAWEADHFGHEINKQAFLALPEGDTEREQGLKQSQEAQAVLESSIKAAKSQRDKMRAARPAATPTTPTQPTTPTAGQQ